MNIQHRKEKENLKTIIGWHEHVVIIAGEIDITEEFYRLARAIVIEAQQDDGELSESRARIVRMKECIFSSGGADVFPAVAIQMNRCFNRLSIVDGHHRIIALYESGVRSHPALLLRRGR